MKQDIQAQAPSGESYNLPVCDVDSERRNFPGYTERQTTSYEDISEPGNTGEDWRGKERYADKPKRS